ncbi:phosphatidylglycerophosphatase A [Paracoccus sp. TK19116]|uniref:Phosphatidylglycerophosphatase A n=1 Tax=Paracoccus albicereus TaxID=2922394 RepID=A0ABT1MWF4_9RHOB|nr:phosphatidylglycerophosphatase A [Paracoccus albicereus]MCQ0971856.1 phosphatidylglycerophosphatase A [Paracoccus albicereus]
MITLIVTFFGIGRLHPAPGTWGSLAATILAVLLYRAGGAYLLPLAFLLVTMLGFWAVPLALVDSTEPDPGEIVIDEVAGQWLALCFTMIPLARHGVPIMSAWPAFVVPFLMFRLFDIWKPWLVGSADRRGDPVGLMLDDLWAGLFAGLTSVVLAGLYHGLMR